MAKLLIDDILKLDISNASIKKINLFLSTEIKYSDDYMKALAYLAIMMHELRDTNDALKLLFSYVPNLKDMTQIGIISLCDGIIYITLAIKRFDQALKYINIKKDVLPISKFSLYHKDMINLLLKEEKINEAITSLEDYIKEDITKDEKMEYLHILVDLYFKEGKYDLYKEKTKQLISYYKANFKYNEIYQIEKNLLIITFKEQDYITYITEANKALENYEDKNDIFDLASLMILSYIELNDTRRASIVESAYSEEAKTIDSLSAKKFCEAAKSLYEKIGNHLAVRLYENRIEELDNILNVKPKTKKEEKIEYVIPDVKIKSKDLKTPKSIISNITIKPEVAQTEGTTKKITKPKNKVINYKNVIISDFYNQFSLLLEELTKVDLDVKFREYFRQIMPKITAKFDIDEAIIFYFQDEYYFHHYKKERVYDKHFKLDDIKGSLLYFSYENDIEGFIDKEYQENKLDIINKKEYENEFLFSLPLHNELGVMGSIVYLSNKPFLDKDLNYEAIKIITNIINDNLNLYLNINTLKDYYFKNNFIISNMPYGIKEEKDHIIKLSGNLFNNLNVLPVLEENDYYSHINNNDLMIYKNAKDYVYNNIGSKKEIEYDFIVSDRKIRLKEIISSVIIDDIINLISIVEDITIYKNEKEALRKLAYTNPISKLQTELKLLKDLAKLDDLDKFGLAILYIDDFKIYKELYGYNFEYQLIYKLGDVLTEILKDEFNMGLYHLNNGNFAILVEDENDKRVINAKLRIILDKAKKELEKVNKRLNINFICGVYRSLKNEKELNVSNYLIYANDALMEAVNEIEFPKISFYDAKTARSRFEDNALVTHISESIDAGLIILTYKQIVDVTNFMVLGYKLGINLSNYEIEEERLYEVINRRGLRNKINDYIINKLMIEEKMFYNKTHSYLNIYLEFRSIDIDVRFLLFIKKQLSYYKIKPEFICFVFDNLEDVKIKDLKKLGFSVSSSNLYDLYHNRCDYFFLDYKTNKELTSKINDLCNEYNSKLIINNVDNKEDIDDIKNKNIDYIVGNYYKRLFTINDIIKKIEE